MFQQVLQKAKHQGRARRRRRKFSANGGRFHKVRVFKREQRLADDRRIERLDRYYKEELEGDSK